MKYSIKLPLASLLLLSTNATAAEKIPLPVFLADLRDHLYDMASVNPGQTARPVISNIHVELNLVVEKDAQGRTQYFVLDGVTEQRDVVTQKLSFDMALQPGLPGQENQRPGRVYSTRRREQAPQPGWHPPYYMPDIYPVIPLDKHR